jgi:undecaprenyl pyrophosphate phosphatase UppP
MAVRVRGSTSLLGLIWVIVGIVVAWIHDYITVDLLRRLIAAVLAIFLWFLVLLGVNLHLH